MVAQLRTKPGGETIPVTMGSFADVDVEGQFELIFAVFTTFFALPSQAEQVRCFANVARPGWGFRHRSLCAGCGALQCGATVGAADFDG